MNSKTISKGTLPTEAMLFMVHETIDPNRYVHVIDNLVPETLAWTALCGINTLKKETKKGNHDYATRYTTSHPVVTCPECIAKMAVCQATTKSMFYADILKITLDLYQYNNVVWVILFKDKSWHLVKAYSRGVGEL